MPYSRSSTSPYHIEIKGIDLNFSLSISTKADLELAEHVIEYVMGKVRAQIRQADQEQNTTVDPDQTTQSTNGE